MLIGIAKVYQQMKRGKFDNEELERQLNNRGLMNRFFGGYAEKIDKPWKMYPVGVLFGLGFDTATEVALLVLAGNAVAGGLPFWAILSLPILFAAGMCLFDTIDGCFMNFAYDWAFSKPVRKVFYNLTITGLSVFVALFIGTIELVGLIGQELNFNDPFFNFFANFNINTAGFIIVGAFAATWADRGALVALRQRRGEVGRQDDPARACRGHYFGLTRGGLGVSHNATSVTHCEPACVSRRQGLTPNIPDRCRGVAVAARIPCWPAFITSVVDSKRVLNPWSGGPPIVRPVPS